MSIPHWLPHMLCNVACSIPSKTLTVPSPCLSNPLCSPPLLQYHLHLLFPSNMTDLRSSYPSSSLSGASHVNADHAPNVATAHGKSVLAACLTQDGHDLPLQAELTRAHVAHSLGHLKVKWLQPAGFQPEGGRCSTALGRCQQTALPHVQIVLVERTLRQRRWCPLQGVTLHSPQQGQQCHCHNLLVELELPRLWRGRSSQGWLLHPPKRLLERRRWPPATSWPSPSP